MTFYAEEAASLSASPKKSQGSFPYRRLRLLLITETRSSSPTTFLPSLRKTKTVAKLRGNPAPAPRFPNLFGFFFSSREGFMGLSKVPPTFLRLSPRGLHASPTKKNGNCCLAVFLFLPCLQFTQLSWESRGCLHKTGKKGRGRRREAGK